MVSLCCQIAYSYSVPRSTLQDSITSPVVHGRNNGYIMITISLTTGLYENYIPVHGQIKGKNKEYMVVKP